MKRILLSLILLMFVVITSCANPIETKSTDMVAANITYYDGYIDARYSVTSGRAVYQDPDILDEARQIIKTIPYPHYYSEQDGTPLITNQVLADIWITIYSYKTGKAILQAKAEIPDKNGVYLIIKLLYQEPNEYEDGELMIIHCSEEIFTLDDLRDNPDYFYWERDNLFIYYISD